MHDLSEQLKRLPRHCDWVVGSARLVHQYWAEVITPFGLHRGIGKTPCDALRIAFDVMEQEEDASGQRPRKKTSEAAVKFVTTNK